MHEVVDVMSDLEDYSEFQEGFKHNEVCSQYRIPPHIMRALYEASVKAKKSVMALDTYGLGTISKADYVQFKMRETADETTHLALLRGRIDRAERSCYEFLSHFCSGNLDNIAALQPLVPQLLKAVAQVGSGPMQVLSEMVSEDLAERLGTSTMRLLNSHGVHESQGQIDYLVHHAVQSRIHDGLKLLANLIIIRGRPYLRNQVAVLRCFRHEYEISDVSLRFKPMSHTPDEQNKIRSSRQQMKSLIQNANAVGLQPDGLLSYHTRCFELMAALSFGEAAHQGQQFVRERFDMNSLAEFVYDKRCPWSTRGALLCLVRAAFFSNRNSAEVFNSIATWQMILFIGQTATTGPSKGSSYLDKQLLKIQTSNSWSPQEHCFMHVLPFLITFYEQHYLRFKAKAKTEQRRVTKMLGRSISEALDRETKTPTHGGLLTHEEQKKMLSQALTVIAPESTRPGLAAPSRARQSTAQLMTRIRAKLQAVSAVTSELEKQRRKTVEEALSGLSSTVQGANLGAELQVEDNNLLHDDDPVVKLDTTLQEMCDNKTFMKQSELLDAAHQYATANGLDLNSDQYTGVEGLTRQSTQIDDPILQRLIASMEQTSELRRSSSELFESIVLNMTASHGSATTGETVRIEILIRMLRDHRCPNLRKKLLQLLQVIVHKKKDEEAERATDENEADESEEATGPEDGVAKSCLDMNLPHLILEILQ